MGLLDSLLYNSDSYGGQGGGLLDFLRTSQMQQGQYQPGPGFPQTEPPASFADRFGAAPGAPPAFAPSGRAFVSAQFDPQTYAPNQAQPIAVGDYQMPRIGNAQQFASDPAAIPQNAQPAQGQLPQGAPMQQPAPMQAPQQQTMPNFLGGQQGAGIGDRLSAGMNNFANAGGLLPALVGGISGLANGQRTDPQGMALQDRRAQFDAVQQTLIQGGMSPREAQSKAMLAVMNPEAGKTILTEALTSKQEYKTEKDALGAEHGYWIDKNKQTKRSADTEGSVGGIGAPQVLAPGVAKYDPSLTGEQYINQFGPEVKAAIKAQINGDVMPTGNPRLQAIASVSKTFATKYAQDMGIPFSDALYAEKRKLKTDLASSNNSSMGGILSNGESSFAHLAEAGQSMADLGNTSHNFPLGGAIAHGQNYIGNALGGSATQGKVKALNNNLGRYGQESTKFYAGSGGGVEERTAARKEMNAETTSSEEYASYLEKEKSLMVDRLKSKFDQIRQTLGEEEAQRVIAKHTPDIQKNIEKIDASIAELRGEQTTTKEKPSALPSGWSVKVN